MAAPWNDALLAAPPRHTAPAPRAAPADVDDLKSIAEDAAQVLASQAPLHQEGAILSRLIYKFDRKFRTDIGYQSLKKVNTALRRYLRIDLAKDVDDFASLLPSVDSDEDYLPTRQMLEYLLVRLQSFSKLMVRLVVCAKKAAIFYWDRVTRGESHWMSLMPYAVMSRIWSLCTLLLDQSCKWYTRLYEYLDILPQAGMPFLPDDYSLPKDIKQWLDWDNIDEHGKFKWSRNKCIEVISTLQEVDSEECLDILQYMHNVREESKNEAVTEQTRSVNRDDELETDNKVTPMNNNVITQSKKRKVNDVGESISRANFNKLAQNLTDAAPMSPVLKLEEKIKPMNPKVTHSIEGVSSEKTLRMFIAKEERLRNNGNKQSLCGHLSFMQWQSLKSAAAQLYGAGLTDGVVSKKFKKIWKNKCTEYL